MNAFGLIACVPVDAIAAQLDAACPLWDANTERRDAKNSPHTAMSDIWVRYADGPVDHQQPHVSVMHPAWNVLPALHGLVFDLMRNQQATQLGGILITRIPPGGVIHPHDDRGSWHAEFYNRKVYVVLRSNARCINECEGDEVNMRTGEVWTFDNLRSHSVTNGGATERITLIICMRVEA